MRREITVKKRKKCNLEPEFNTKKAIKIIEGLKSAGIRQVVNIAVLNTESIYKITVLLSKLYVLHSVYYSGNQLLRISVPVHNRMCIRDQKLPLRAHMVHNRRPRALTLSFNHHHSCLFLTRLKSYNNGHSYLYCYSLLGS